MVDAPVLQHVVDEAREAGIEHFIFVTGRNKAVIEDYFDIAYELEDTLRLRGKTKELEALVAQLPEAGRDELHPPAGPRSASAMPSGARAISWATNRSRVLLPDMVTMGSGPQRHALPRPMYRGSRGPWRQYHRRRGGGPGGDAQIWRGRDRARPWRCVRDHRHDRKAGPGHGALERDHFGPLRVEPRNLRHSRPRRKGRGGAKSS